MEEVLGEWMYFQISLLLWEVQVIRDLLCVRDIGETSFNRLLLLLILKSSHERCSIEKGVLKNFANFTEKHLCWSLFNKVAKLRACNIIRKRLQPREICEIFKSTCFEENFWTTSSVSSGNFIYNEGKRYN